MRGLLARVLGLVACGCAPGLDLSEVPAAPLAYLHQAADSISDLESFVEAVQVVGRARGEDRARRPLRTSIALLTVPEGRSRIIPDAGEGHYPLDWSSDGLRLLIGRARGGALTLFGWNRLSGAWDRLTPSESFGAAAFGPGPIRLAFVGASVPLDRADGAAVRRIVVRRDGTAEQPLAETSGGTDPDVSSDGRHVLFVRPHSRPGQEPFILISELGSTEPRIVGRGDQARFSRDGLWIVYVRGHRGSSDVWMMRSDGAAKRPVATSGFDEEYPALSPDGRFVVYASARERGISQLYMTELESGTETQLTYTGQSGRPVW